MGRSSRDNHSLRITLPHATTMFNQRKPTSVERCAIALLKRIISKCVESTSAGKTSLKYAFPTTYLHGKIPSENIAAREIVIRSLKKAGYRVKFVGANDGKSEDRLLISWNLSSLRDKRNKTWVNVLFCFYSSGDSR